MPTCPGSKPVSSSSLPQRSAKQEPEAARGGRNATAASPQRPRRQKRHQLEVVSGGRLRLPNGNIRPPLGTVDQRLGEDSCETCQIGDYAESLLLCEGCDKVCPTEVPSSPPRPPLPYSAALLEAKQTSQTPPALCLIVVAPRSLLHIMSTQRRHAHTATALNLPPMRAGLSYILSRSAAQKGPKRELAVSRLCCSGVHAQ